MGLVGIPFAGCSNLVLAFHYLCFDDQIGNRSSEGVTKSIESF
jgi:hypothetical protein